MATQAPGRSREELLAGAAHLRVLADSGDLDCSDSENALRRVARDLEQQSADAPPITATGELTDDRLLQVLEFAFGTGWASALGNAGIPQQVALTLGHQARRRLHVDPLIREELLTAARALIVGRCSCGASHPGHADHGGES